MCRLRSVAFAISNICKARCVHCCSMLCRWNDEAVQLDHWISDAHYELPWSDTPCYIQQFRMLGLGAKIRKLFCFFLTQRWWQCRENKTYGNNNEKLNVWRMSVYWELLCRKFPSNRHSEFLEILAIQVACYYLVFRNCFLQKIVQESRIFITDQGSSGKLSCAWSLAAASAALLRIWSCCLSSTTASLNKPGCA